jgi:hypothetical protein
MIEHVIPVGEFLDRAINASRSSHYLAFISVLARSADGDHLQSEMLRNWESLDDLTADQILVLSPKTQTDTSDAVVRHAREAAGFVNSSLTFAKGGTKSWEQTFWGASSPTPQPQSHLSGLGAIHSPRRPQNEIDKKAAITASVSEASRYFGIPESWLPCVVALSLVDQQVLIISVDQWFSIYALLRAVLIDYEPVVRKMARYKSRLAELPSVFRRTEEAIGRVRSQLKTTERAQAHTANSWTEQIAASCRLLEAVSAASPRCREFSQFLCLWFNDRVDTPPDFDSRLDSWLLLATSSATKEIPDHLAERLKTRLPGAIQRKKDGYLAGLAPTVAAVQQLEALCAADVEKLRHEIEELNREAARLPGQISALEGANPISRCFLTAAARDNYGATRADLDLPRALHGWIAVHLTKTLSNTQRSSSGAQKYDLALSFAGEDRVIAREIASRLRAEGATVFFDEFEKYRLWGVNLSDYLTAIYFERARFCMMIISESYVRKMWTGLERQAMQAGALIARIEGILPVRIDSTDAPGLLPTVGYLDYAQEGLDGVVSATLMRIRSLRGSP